MTNKQYEHLGRAIMAAAELAQGVWIGECEICGQRKPCTDLWHDWKMEVRK